MEHKKSERLFKSIHIDANDLNDAYFSLLWNIYESGRKYKINSGSFAGATRLEFDFVSGFIHFPHTRPLAPIMPPGIPPTTTDEKIEDYFANYLMNPILAENEHYKYAQWINGTDHYAEFYYTKDIRQFNQSSVPLKNLELKTWEPNYETPIEWVIRHFKEAGHGNNHCYINIGNSDSQFNYDIPYSNENDRRTSPCLRGLSFKIKAGHLITSVVYRSWDLFSGFPENMGGFTLLNEYMANEIGVSPGPLSFTCDGLHCYNFQLELVSAILNKGE